jgi:hypothetical protein
MSIKTFYSDQQNKTENGENRKGSENANKNSKWEKKMEKNHGRKIKNNNSHLQ